MIVETIEYTDFNGVDRVEDFYFNLTEAEATDLQLSIEGNLGDMIEKIIAAKDMPKIASIFKKLIFMSYGIKSQDGRRFEKSEQLSTEFSQTAAYSKLYMKLATDSKAAAAFVNGVIPKITTPALLEKINENRSENNVVPMNQ